MHAEGGDKLGFFQELEDKGRPIAPEDQEPDLTDVATYFVNMFQEINEWRNTGGMGPSRITLADVHYYCRYTGVVISYTGLRVIRLLDDCFLSEYFKAQKK